MVESQWQDHLSQKELLAIAHAEYYAAHFRDAAIPGHNQFLLLAKIASICDGLQDKVNAGGRDIIIKKVVYDPNSNCWRDVETGVRTEVP